MVDIQKRFSPRLGLLAAAVLSLSAVATFHCALPDYRDALNKQRSRAGLTVVDRNGRLLRLVPDEMGRFNLWCNRKRIPQVLKLAFIAAEDRRFYYHCGFDPIAILRAACTNLRRWRTVSGASTITEQVVRLIHPRPRTYLTKMLELLESVKMESQLSKDEILELHLNLSPMGGNLRGVGAASRLYFGKDVERISTAEAAILAVIPRSPSRYDFRKATGRKRLFAEKDRVLRRMAALGWISPEQLQLITGPTVNPERKATPLEAPHFVDLLLRRVADGENPIKTTVDLEVQHSLERILLSHKDRLAATGIHQIGAIVIAAQSSEVLGTVGSFSYSERGQGFNNAILARRSAGSTLKPFLYALALQRGYNVFSEIPDTFRSYPTPHGEYLPFNADRRWYGPVTIRLALGNSLNMPAVKMLRSLGVNEFYKLLTRLDLVDNTSMPPESYGLGLAIGNLDVSLYRLTQAYATLARGGVFIPLRLTFAQKTAETRIFSRPTVYAINDILADPSARLLTFGNPAFLDFGFPVCVKTGTSSSYRDCWTIAYTSRHVVGIWAGNFDGSPTTGGAGASALGPIAREIMEYLYAAGEPEPFVKPAGVRDVSICWLSGKFASPKCPHVTKEWLLPGSKEPGVCDFPHGRDENYYLGAQYAHWIQRREVRQGRGRFRLINPEAALPGSVAAYESSSTMGPRSAAATSRVEIVSPHNFDRFILSPYGSSRVLFRAVPHPVVDHVVWLVDGVEIVRTHPPYEFFWKLVRGRHTVHAVIPKGAAAKVIFQVD
ncbi:MAG: penicillin-binding protein 1C [Desulfomonilaceae bacterium]